MPRSARNRLITDNLPLVGYLASQFHNQQSLVTREELASAGALALVMAADSFDAELGVPFSAYARRRILGAFIDEMRAHDWASRSIRKRVKETTRVRETLAKALDRPPSAEEIATTMGVDVASVLESLSDARRVVMSFEDEQIELSVASSWMRPDEVAEMIEHREIINTAVDALPERMRFIIRGVYFEDRTVRSIADELGVTHAAVSQQRSQAVRLLGEALRGHFGLFGMDSSTVATKVSSTAREQYLARLAERGRGFAQMSLPQSASA